MIRARAVAIVVAALALASPCAASAREFAPCREGGGLVENPDGTYSLWGEGCTKPLRTYSKDEADAMAAEDEGLAVDAGEAANTVSEVDGITTDQQSAVDQMVTRLQTAQPYGSPGEADVGRSVIDDAEAIGTDDTAGSMWSDVPELAAGVGVFTIGLHVGNDIDRVFGLPTFFNETANAAVTRERLKGEWTGSWEILSISRGGLHHCNEFPGAPGMGHNEYCLDATEQYQGVEEAEISGVWDERDHIDQYFDLWSGEPNPGCGAGMPCYEPEPGTIEYYLDLETITEAGFPAKGLTAPNEFGPYETPLETTPPEKVKDLPAPPAPQVVPPAPATFIAHERETEFPGVETDGEPVPDPTQIEIPVPEHDELGTHYVNRLHELGLTDVTERTLPETDTDPSVGPEDVAYTSPAAGIRVKADAAVTVEVNPDDAPAPNAGIGPPTLPGIHLPNLGVACRSFPFGVPCWIIKEFESWSGEGQAPVWTIGSFKVDGQTVPETQVHLAVLEPVMEVLRPFMVIFSTIGLVILFYRFATGRGVGSGGDDTAQDAE